MNILITGIYGFLGFHLAEKLSETHQVFGIYNSKTKNFAGSSISAYKDLDEIPIIPDVIILCHAAVVSGETVIDKDLLQKVNVSFTNEVIQKFRNVRTIYISSVSVFGQPIGVISEHTENSPVTDYATSKLMAETLVLENEKNVVVRFSSIYGINMKENTLIPNYCNQALQSQQIEVWGNGERFQNYIHVDDAVKLIEKIIIFNGNIAFPLLGVCSREYSNREVAQEIADITGSKIIFINQDQSPSFHYNNLLTQKVLNWQCETNLNRGIKQFIEWKKRQF